MDVLAVADEFSNNVPTLAARADRAGFAMMNAGHGIIQVRQMRRTRIENGAGIGVGAVCVRDRHRA